MARRFILTPDPILAEDRPLTIAYGDELNAQQCEAVTAPGGALLVVAGAGTGKTRTLVYRVAYLVELGVNPESIVLLTFTRRAASEMLSRASLLLDGRCGRVRGGTFHSFSVSILRRHASEIGYPSNFTILDASDAADVVDVLRTAEGLHRAEKRFPTKRRLYEVFSRAVNRGVALDTLLQERYPQFLDYASAILELERKYVEYKRRHALMDYDDLLLLAVQLLEDNDRLREHVASRCIHLLVDEYQDTNLLQAQLVELLASVHGNVMAVGDDAQSIYRFRGANPENIFSFPTRHSGARVLKLEQNYRSTQSVLDLANIVLRSARKKYDKELFSERGKGDLPAIVPAPDDRFESRFVSQMVLQLRESGVPLSRQAVLFRSSFNSYALEVELNRRNIPFVKYGGMKLSEAAHVKDLIAHLKILENPQDAVSWNRVLRLLDGVGPKTARDLIEWIMEAGSDPYRLQDRPYSPRYVEALTSLFETLRAVRQSSARPGEEIEALVEYYEPILKRKYFEDYPKRQQDLEHFIGLAQRFDTRESLLSSIALDPVELTALDGDPVSEDESPLVLSTIHSAKGLEFNSVFVIQALEGILPSAYSLKDPEALDEELRLFYVAVTRAEENLFISYPATQYRRFEGEYLTRPSRYLEDVSEEILEPWSLVEELPPARSGLSPASNMTLGE
jgi:DNA helicase-2/ATP-dependent DNA helicase PcrA